MYEADFWTGEFGDSYTQRHGITPAVVNSRTRFWADILRHLPQEPYRIMEVGANVGLNIHALSRLVSSEFVAVEPNTGARTKLRESGLVPSYGLLSQPAPPIQWASDGCAMVFTCGVLVHVDPDDLKKFCAEIYRVSSKWIVCIEYFSKNPRMVPYHGYANKLWTRDFGEFYIQNFPVKPIACGFAWHMTTGMDDVTYWIFEKAGP